MISSAFKGAYQNEVSQQNQGISTITEGVKDTALLVAGTVGFTGGFGTSKLGSTASKGTQHALAGRVGGVGGNIMLASLQEKKDSAIANEENKSLFTIDKATSALGDNPINNFAKKTLNTVFETLQTAKENGIINKKGNISSSIGDIDPSSELGKRIVSELGKGE